MFRRGRIAFIAAGCIAALGAMLLIPGDKEVAVADTPVVTSLSSEETVAAIDAMLGPNPVASPAADIATVKPVAPAADANLQTAVLTTPEDTPTADLEGASVDPNLRPDSIGPQAVNLRAGPSSDTATVTVLQPGLAVQTGEADGGWVEVTLADGTTGWVYSRYLASVAAAAPAPSGNAASDDDQTTGKAVIKGAKGDLEGRTAKITSSLVARSRPDVDAERIFRTEPGERVKIIDVRGKWIRILTADGSDGWIQRG
jgi:SH3-like domain-containing protein